MITISKLSKRLAGHNVLSGIDLEVGEGEVVALIGPSGTGKSVLLKHIVGLIEPDSGDIRIDGRSVARADAPQLAGIRRGLGYVFQDAALLDFMTVHDNLRLALDDDEWRGNRAAATLRIREAVTAVNLPLSVLDRRPGELSGGMRKRAGVARAIINRPRVVLYDEPTTGLDPRNVAAIHRLVVETRDRLGATSIVITHDVQALPSFADRVILLDRGRIHFDGAPGSLLESSEPAVLHFTGRAAADAPSKEASWPAMHEATTR